MITLEKLKSLVTLISKFESFEESIKKAGLEIDAEAPVLNSFYGLVDLYIDEFNIPNSDDFYDWVYGNFDSFGEMADSDIEEFYKVLTNND